MNSIEKLSGAKRALIEAQSLEDIAAIHDIAVAAQTYAKAAKLGMEAQNEAAEVARRAERKAGEVLREMPKNPGGRPTKTPSSVEGVSPTLKDLGIEEKESHRWQQIASVPEETFEEYIQETREKGSEITQAGLLRVARGQNSKDRPTPPLPDGKYKVIYADPPWPVGSIVMDKWESPIEDKYPTMSLDEIMGLPVSELAADDCSLFLWTTHTYLPDALNVIKTWGFKYHCCITWNKGNGWTQFGFHRMTEFLLFAYKGRMEIDQYGEAIPTLINEPKTYHSKKPDLIRDLIKGKTQGPRLEMFARGQYDGWTSWGNDVNG